MKRLWLVAGCVLAVCVPAGQARRLPPERPAGCHRMFWLGEGIRFAHRAFDGAGQLSRYDRRHLRRMVRCQHNRHARRWLSRFDRRLARGHAARVRRARWERAHPFSSAVASWYDAAGGPIACSGMDSYGMGVANRTLPCGTRVEICYSGCVAAVVFDRGPYVAGRDWDLSAAVKDAVGFPDGVATVRYRLR